MSPSSIVVYGAHWCPDCRRSKQFLGEHQIPYEWVDIEQDAAAEAYVIEKNEGKRIIPTIVFADDSFLVEPSNAEIAAKLGLKTSIERRHFPLIVVGGGPAGLTAAFYTAREGIDTLVQYGGNKPIIFEWDSKTVRQCLYFLTVSLSYCFTCAELY